MINALIVLALLILIIIGIIFYAYIHIKSKLKYHLRNMGLNGNDVMSMLKQNQNIIDNTPKSVSGGDSLFLPLIKKDFPEINIETLKSNIKTCIKDILTGIETNDDNLIKNKYSKNVYSFYQDLKTEKNKKFDNIKFHKCTISDYKKNESDATIIFQIAFEYYINNQKIIQEKYEINYTYYYNNDTSGNTIRCSYCGAPLKKLGSKYCEYCGSKINANSDFTWTITYLKKF